MVVGISHFDLKRNPINTKLISSAEHQKTSVHLSFISFWHFCAAIKSLSADFIRIKTSPEGRPWWSNTMWTQWVRISVENSARKSRTSSIVATEGRPQRHIQSLTFVGGTNCWHSTGIMGGVGSGMRRAKKKQFNTCWTLAAVLPRSSTYLLPNKSLCPQYILYIFLTSKKGQKHPLLAYHPGKTTKKMPSFPLWWGSAVQRRPPLHQLWPYAIISTLHFTWCLQMKLQSVLNNIYIFKNPTGVVAWHSCKVRFLAVSLIGYGIWEIWTLLIITTIK